jgi:hypothetical protein
MTPGLPIGAGGAALIVPVTINDTVPLYSTLAPRLRASTSNSRKSCRCPSRRGRSDLAERWAPLPGLNFLKASRVILDFRDHTLRGDAGAVIALTDGDQRASPLPRRASIHVRAPAAAWPSASDAAVSGLASA